MGNDEGLRETKLQKSLLGGYMVLSNVKKSLINTD